LKPAPSNRIGQSPTGIADDLIGKSDQSLLRQQVALVLQSRASQLQAVGTAILGKLTGSYSIEYVYRLCVWMTQMSVITVFLPNLHTNRR